MKTNTWGGPQRSPPFRLPCTTSRRFLICIPSSKEFGSRSLQGLNSESHFLFPMHPTPPLCSPFSAGLGRERGWGAGRPDSAQELSCPCIMEDTGALARSLVLK